jgi:ABC-type transport system substrate-binding protein
MDMGIGRTDVVEIPPEMLRQASQQHLTVLASGPENLLLLQLGSTGPLANPQFRQAVALAVDRNALYNVIFQRQGEIAASLLPGVLSGYTFLFSPERNLNRAHELHGGATPSQLTVAVEDGNAAMQLSAERIVLNLREAGFQVQIASVGGKSQADIVLRQIHLGTNDPWAALDEMVQASGQRVSISL